MKPEFVTRLALNKTLMLEWYKADFRANHKMFALVHGVLIAIYLLAAGTFFYAYTVFKAVGMLVAAIAMLVLAALFLLNVFFQYRIQVALALRKDKEKQLQKPFTMLFYPDSLVVMEGFSLDDAAQVRRAEYYLNNAEGLEMDFLNIMQEMEQLEGNDDEKLLKMRDRLEGLQTRMDSLNSSISDIGGQLTLRYAQLDGYAETPSLHVLYFAGQAVLVDKNAFAKGEPGQFKPYIRKAVEQQLAQTTNEDMEKKLIQVLEHLARPAGK